jgi:hypothetical protein
MPIHAPYAHIVVLQMLNNNTYIGLGGEVQAKKNLCPNLTLMCSLFPYGHSQSCKQLQWMTEVERENMNTWDFGPLKHKQKQNPALPQAAGFVLFGAGNSSQVIWTGTCDLEAWVCHQ